MQSSRTTAGFGPVLRWNFQEGERWRAFVDGGTDLLQSGSPAYIIPWTNVGYNLFLRGRGGASVRLSSSYWPEAAFGWGTLRMESAGLANS